MAKLGQSIVRQGMAEGIANLSFLPMGWQNWCRILRGKVWLSALLILLLCRQDGTTGAGYNDARYD